MTTKKEQAALDKAEAIERLRELCPPGSTIVCVLEHVSASGMSRRIKFYNERLDYLNGYIEKLGTYKRPRDADGYIKHDGLRVDGAGMDMGFAVVYDVASTLYRGTDRAGYQLKHRWL